MGIRRFLLQAFFAGLLLFNVVEKSYASSCDHKRQDKLSIEMEFLYSDIVLAGTINRFEAENVVFNNLEIFKAPQHDVFSKPEISLYSGRTIENAELIGTEWIIYANIDSQGRIIMNPCGYSGKSPEQRILDTRKNVDVHEIFKLVLTGKLTKIERSWVQGASSQKGYSKTQAELAVNEILINKTNPKLDDVTKLLLNVNGCDSVLEVGHNYFVMAKGYSRWRRDANNAPVRKSSYHSQCFVGDIVDVDTKTILRKFAKDTGYSKVTK